MPLKSKKRFLRLLDDSCQTRRFRGGLVALKPRCSVGEHVTDRKEEVLIILEGRARVSCAGFKDLRAQAPELVYIPPETRHDVQNAGKGTLRYLYLVTPVV